MRILTVIGMLAAVALASCGGAPQMAPAEKSGMNSRESMDEYIHLQSKWDRNQGQGDAAARACAEQLRALESAPDGPDKDQARQKLAASLEKLNQAVLNGYELTRRMHGSGGNAGEIRAFEGEVESWVAVAKKAEAALK